MEELRLEKAKLLGAEEAINAEKRDSVREIELTHNRRVDVALEAVGSSITVNEAIQMVRPSERVVIIGTDAKPQLEINVHEVISKKLDFLRVWRYLRAFPSALTLIANRIVNTQGIVIHRFPLDKTEKTSFRDDENKEKLLKFYWY